MELLKIHEALCEPTRLRLLHVLTAGPLCVCHFQAVLREPQVKISKHLGYLKARGLVTSRREGNWMIYALPAKPSATLRVQLACLQAAAKAEPLFQRDRARLAKLAPGIATDGPCGCGPACQRT